MQWHCRAVAVYFSGCSSPKSETVPATRGHGMDIAVFLSVPWVEPDQFAAQGAEFGWWDFEVFALFGVAAQAR